LVGLLGHDLGGFFFSRNAMACPMSNRVPPKEFWIDEVGVDDYFDDPMTMDHVNLIHISARQPSGDKWIRVIEFRAYEELIMINQKQAEVIEDQIKRIQKLRKDGGE
jgi:hypothetical protein